MTAIAHRRRRPPPDHRTRRPALAGNRRLRSVLRLTGAELRLVAPGADGGRRPHRLPPRHRARPRRRVRPGARSRVRRAWPPASTTWPATWAWCSPPWASSPSRCTWPPTGSWACCAASGRPASSAGVLVASARSCSARCWARWRRRSCWRPGPPSTACACPVDPLGVLGWYVAGLACFIAIGVALGSLLPSGRSANALGNLVFVPMFLLGGGGPPRAVMTRAMRTVSDVLPLSHLVGGLRQSWLGTTDDPHTLWWPLLVAAAAVGVAVVAARRRAG